MRRAVMAEGNCTPRVDVVHEGFFGGPGTEAADVVRGLAEVCTIRSATSPKGVPSEAAAELELGELAKDGGVL